MTNPQPNLAGDAGLNQLLAAYLAMYQPQNEADRQLVHLLAGAALRLRRLEQIEARLWQQTEPDLDELSRFERLRTSAEASFHRALRALAPLLRDADKTKPTPVLVLPRTEPEYTKPRAGAPRGPAAAARARAIRAHLWRHGRKPVF